MRLLGGALLAVVMVGAGCYHDEYSEPAYAYQTPRTVSIATPPPSPVDEVPPPRPYAGAEWMAGFWQWRPDAGRYVWVAGHWATPPRSGVVWVPPSWHSDARGGWYATPGRWAPGVSVDRYGRQVWYDTLGRPHYM